MVKWDKITAEWPKRDWASVWIAVKCFLFHRLHWSTDLYADITYEPVRVICRKCSCWWSRS